MEKIALLIGAMRDPRTPWYAKVTVILAVAYILSPIDIIPDFIPVIGLLDEVILIPIAYKLVIRWVPDEVKADYDTSQPLQNVHFTVKFFGVGIVLTIWGILIYIAYLLFKPV